MGRLADVQTARASCDPGNAAVDRTADHRLLELHQAGAKLREWKDNAPGQVDEYHRDVERRLAAGRDRKLGVTEQQAAGGEVRAVPRGDAARREERDELPGGVHLAEIGSANVGVGGAVRDVGPRAIERAIGCAGSEAGFQVRGGLGVCDDGARGVVDRFGPELPVHVRGLPGEAKTGHDPRLGVGRGGRDGFAGWVQEEAVLRAFVGIAPLPLRHDDAGRGDRPGKVIAGTWPKADQVIPPSVER
ncbi:MAG: hypothetical protein M5U18_09110 [Dehalococcoidia bacterium]|nr:hypothetical protein [Dehalococcoidia bacterium]